MQNLVNTIQGPGADAEKQGARQSRVPLSLQRITIHSMLIH